MVGQSDAMNHNLFSTANPSKERVFGYVAAAPRTRRLMGQRIHRISNKLSAPKSLGKRNETVIAGTVAEVLTKAARMNATRGWDVLDEILEPICKETANPVIRNSPRQRGLFQAISELQEVLPRLADTSFTAGDLAGITPMTLKSPRERIYSKTCSQIIPRRSTSVGAAFSCAHGAAATGAILARRT
jgi:hypothetical protein